MKRGFFEPSQDVAKHQQFLNPRLTQRKLQNTLTSRLPGQNLKIATVARNNVIWPFMQKFRLLASLVWSSDMSGSKKLLLIFYSELFCMAQYFRLNRKIYTVHSLYTDIIRSVESFFRLLWSAINWSTKLITINRKWRHVNAPWRRFPVRRPLWSSESFFLIDVECKPSALINETG